MDQNCQARVYSGSSAELPDLNVEVNALVRSEQSDLEVGQEDNGWERCCADVEGKFILK